MEIVVKTEDLLTVPQAAKQIGRQKMTLYRWIYATPPKINYVELGGVLFIPKSEVERIKKKQAAEEIAPVA